MFSYPVRGGHPTAHCSLVLSGSSGHRGPTHLPEERGFSGLRSGERAEGGGRGLGSIPSHCPKRSAQLWCRRWTLVLQHQPRVFSQHLLLRGVCMGGLFALLKSLLLSTVPSASRSLCSSSHHSASVGGVCVCVCTFPVSSLVGQAKMFSHQGVDNPGAAHTGQGTRVMPTRETHANLLLWDTWPWLPAA